MTGFKTIGILGGMGPEAGVYLHQKIIEKTPAQFDQDHVPVLLYTCPQIPDRKTCIDSQQFTKVEEPLAEAIAHLEQGGAQCISIACNTAHFFSSAIQNACTVPFFHLIQETVQHLHTQSIHKVGLLSTTSTIQSRLYHEPLEKQGIVCVVPTLPLQQEVQDMICALKAGQKSLAMTQRLLDIGNTLQEQGVERIVLGCTELPLLINPRHYSAYIDPMEVLAERLISFSKSTETTHL